MSDSDNPGSKRPFGERGSHESSPESHKEPKYHRQQRSGLPGHTPPVGPLFPAPLSIQAPQAPVPGVTPSAASGSHGSAPGTGLQGTHNQPGNTATAQITSSAQGSERPQGRPSRAPFTGFGLTARASMGPTQPIAASQQIPREGPSNSLVPMLPAPTHHAPDNTHAPLTSAQSMYGPQRLDTDSGNQPNIEDSLPETHCTTSRNTHCGMMEDIIRRAIRDGFEEAGDFIQRRIERSVQQSFNLSRDTLQNFVEAIARNTAQNTTLTADAARELIKSQINSALTGALEKQLPGVQQKIQNANEAAVRKAIEGLLDTLNQDMLEGVSRVEDAVERVENHTSEDLDGRVEPTDQTATPEMRNAATQTGDELSNGRADYLDESGGEIENSAIAIENHPEDSEADGRAINDRVTAVADHIDRPDTGEAAVNARIAAMEERIIRINAENANTLHRMAMLLGAVLLVLVGLGSAAIVYSSLPGRNA